MNNYISNLNSYIYDLIGDNPENQIKEIKESKNFLSLRQISIKFKVNRSWLSKWLKNYLTEKFGQRLASKIYKNLWTSSNWKIEDKKDNLLKTVKYQMKSYPKKVEEIDSIHTLSTKLGISRRSVSNWIKESLYNEYGRISGQEIYKNIWNQKHQKKNLTYNFIKDHIIKRGELLLTSKKVFFKMIESPSKRYVDVKCEKGHLWNVRINSLLYLDVSCPMCNELKSEEITRLYMEDLFCTKFPKTTLYSAYKISGQNGGRLQFDGYNGNVIVNGCKFRIAFEYDGIQHDFYPNGYHRTKIDYEKQRINDKKKWSIAQKYNTMIIRLKEFDGFSYKNKERFPQEINRLFQIETGITILQ